MRIATYNIQHGADADGTFNPASTIDTLRAINADIIGLQEVDSCFGTRSDFMDLAQHFADALGMEVAFHRTLPARDVCADTTDESGYGNAILSRFPIAGVEQFFLPGTPHGERRAVTFATIEAPRSALSPSSSDTGAAGSSSRTGGAAPIPLRFATTHLTADSARARLIQARALRELIELEDLPTILVGDINATPLDASYWSLMRTLHDIRTGLRRFLGGFTHSAVVPWRRIDHILLSPGLRSTHSWVPNVRTSDHRPLVAEVELH